MYVCAFMDKDLDVGYNLGSNTNREVERQRDIACTKASSRRLPIAGYDSSRLGRTTDGNGYIVESQTVANLMCFTLYLNI